MALPSAYTETTLSAYMLSTLEGVASLFDWTIDSFSEQVNDTLSLLGAADFTAASDVAAVRAVARYLAWEKAANRAATLYDFQADGGNYRRSQLFDHIVKQRDAARRAAALYVPELSGSDMALHAGFQTVAVEASW